MFERNKNYTRTEIQSLVGGEIQTYLPQKNKIILAGCFNEELNPGCPYEIQAGKKPKVTAKAELLMNQTDTVFPVFTRATQKSKHYTYVGQFRCSSGTNAPNAIKEAELKSGRIAGLSYVLTLEAVA